MSLLVAAVLASWAVLVGAAAPAAADDDPAQQCESLPELQLQETTQITAELVTGGRFQDPEGENQDQEDLPEFCRVALTVDPQINIEVWLPTQSWNGRFRAVGNGYFAGFIAYDDMGAALQAGYATASTDTGHPQTGTDGSWALSDSGEPDGQLIGDFASRSLFQLTEKSQALTQAFYGQAPQYSYFTGCSTGGRQGMMLAQQMPEAYDGILSAAPAINWDRFLAAEMWPQVVMNEELGGPMEGCKLEAATEAATAACDPIDGVLDGVIEDPRLCGFQAQSLIGRSTDCGTITAADARALQAIWDGPRGADGTFLWYGLEPSAPLGDDPLGVGTTGGIWEPGEPGWDRLAGTNPFLVSDEYLKHFVLADPDWDYRSLSYTDYEALFGQSQQMYNGVIGTDDPDLSAFRDAGGQLLMWHGWNDRMIFPRGSIDYYERVQDELGGELGDFYRLFMAPGVDHCAGGPGPQPTGEFDALVDWVENGVAPEQLEAAVVQDGETTRTRPLCLYPEAAVWNGTGSTDEAASFTCGALDAGAPAVDPVPVGGADTGVPVEQPITSSALAPHLGAAAVLISRAVV